MDTRTLDAMGGGGGEGSYSPVYHGAIHLYNLTFWQQPAVQVWAVWWLLCFGCREDERVVVA